jgi:hypothetical protein
MKKSRESRKESKAGRAVYLQVIPKEEISEKA